MLVLFISLIGSSYPDKDLHIHINALNGAGKNRLAPQSGGIGKRFKAIHKDYGMGGQGDLSTVGQNQVAKYIN